MIDHIEFTAEEYQEINQIFDDVNSSIDAVRSSWMENESSSGYKLSTVSIPCFESSIQLFLYLLLTTLQRTQTELAVEEMTSDAVKGLSLRAAVAYAVFAEEDPSYFVDLEALSKAAFRRINK